MIATRSSRPAVGRHPSRLALVLFGIGLVSLLLVSVVALAGFVWPSDAERGEYALGPVADFAPGTVRSFLLTDGGLEALRNPDVYAVQLGTTGISAPKGDRLVHVVRLPNGEVVVLSARSPHLGQAALWNPERETGEREGYRGLFDDSWSLWAVDGTQLFGPAPRDLPSYRSKITSEGVLVIDLTGAEDGPLLRDNRGREYPPPYDVTSGGWATSGWPSQ